MIIKADRGKTPDKIGCKKVIGYLALHFFLSVFILGCATTRYLAVEYPPGSNQFIEIEEIKGNKTFKIRKCSQDVIHYDDHTQVETVCEEKEIEPTPELEKDWEDYWKWQ